MIIIVMQAGANEETVSGVVDAIGQMGLEHNISSGENTVITLSGDIGELELGKIKSFEGVQNVIPVARPWKHVGRETHPENTVVSFGDFCVGAEEMVVMAGPCAVENREWIFETARAVRDAGAKFLRGGAFKPRTSPYAFRGLGKEGLELLAEAREETGLLIITEVMMSNDVPLVASYADVLQIGARNMQNFALLEAAGKSGKPVLLKRGMMASIEELLMSADYLLSHGNENIILCERGIRTFENYTRNTLDISAVPVVKHLSHLPVIVDPSHGVGKREYVPALARAAVAADADGILVEVHVSPDEAYCDGQQSLTTKQFAKMMDELRAVANAVGRNIS